MDGTSSILPYATITKEVGGSIQAHYVLMTFGRMSQHLY